MVLNLIAALPLLGYGAAPSMQAFGKQDAAAPSAPGPFAVPQVGSVHARYSELPANASCEVLVRVAASSVNPSDISPTIASDDFPKILGSDMSGVVLQVGGGCQRLTVGDRVWGDIGANTHSTAGKKTKELGGYAERAVALEAQLGVVPKELSLRDAAVMPKVSLTSLKALKWYTGAPDEPRWRRSDARVLVLGGSGGTGSIGLQLAKAFGAATVLTTTSAANFDYCRSLGADVLIDYHTQDWWDPAVVADASVDVVYDTVGQEGTGARAVQKLRPGGAYVTITGALATPPLPPNVTQAFFINSDTNLASAPLLDELAMLVSQRKLVAPRVDSVFPLSNVSGGFERSRTGHVVGKVVISVGAEEL